MRTRNSIKLIFVLVGVIATVVMARLFFVLMFHYYKEGTTTTVNTFLHDAAALSSGHSTNDAGILILPSWKDFLADFKAAIHKPPSAENPFVRGSLATPILRSPEAIYYVLLTNNRLGEPVYIGKRLDWHATGVMIGELNVLIYWRAFALSIVFAITLTALMLFVLRYLVTPLESLKAWGQTLSASNDNEPTPQIQFRFREFSEIAEVISDNIALQKKSLQNEHEFLQFSSHELRSPLAVMSANIALLNRLTASAPEQQRRVIARIDHATHTMTGIVNTFLWLSRNQRPSDAAEPIELAAMLNRVIEQYRYLISNKPVILTVHTMFYTVTLPEIPTTILLGNVISNAFKYASSGEIVVEQQGTTLRVSNNNLETQAHEHENSGFGLGLVLVQKIAEHYGWQVATVQNGTTYQVEIELAQG